MYALKTKQNSQTYFSKNSQKPKPETLQRKIQSADRFLTPNRPNIFQRTEISRENKTLRQNDVPIYSPQINSLPGIQPIQRKLVFRGKELKKNDTEITNIVSHSDELDEYTDPDGSIKTISGQITESYEDEEHPLTPEQKQEYRKQLLTDMSNSEQLYYIGNKNNIVSILADICRKIKPTITAPNINSNADFVVKLAIMRMYDQSNNDNINSKKVITLGSYKCSQDLIASVKDVVGDIDAQSEYPEYTMATAASSAAPSSTGSLSVDEVQSAAAKPQGRRAAAKQFTLNFGKYTYRSMNLNELNTLKKASTKHGERYSITNSDNISKEAIGKHVGNLTQAVTYNGFLVRFKMKSTFNTTSVIHNKIQGGSEGTKNENKIGLKYENEGTLKDSHFKSFSFYIPDRQGNVKTFLSNVEYFEVFNLGKISGHT